MTAKVDENYFYYEPYFYQDPYGRECTDFSKIDTPEMCNSFIKEYQQFVNNEKFRIIVTVIVGVAFTFFSFLLFSHSPSSLGLMLSITLGSTISFVLKDLDLIKHYNCQVYLGEKRIIELKNSARYSCLNTQK